MVVRSKLISKKATKNGKYIQTKIQISDDNRYLSNDQVKVLSQKLLNKKKDNQKLMIKALTPVGWLTYLSYNDNINNFENVEDYLDGRIENTAKFNDDVSQINVIIMENN